MFLAQQQAKQHQSIMAATYITDTFLIFVSATFIRIIPINFLRFLIIDSKSAQITKRPFNYLGCPVNFILLPFSGISVACFSCISKQTS